MPLKKHPHTPGGYTPSCLSGGCPFSPVRGECTILLSTTAKTGRIALAPKKEKGPSRCPRQSLGRLSSVPLSATQLLLLCV